MQLDTFNVQWRFTGYDSSKQKHSTHPPLMLINFYANEKEFHEQTKVVAVEHDSLQLIDVKKKEIKKLRVGGSEGDPMKSGLDSSRDWVSKVSFN
jgi:hypothetical protein